jgi:pyridinium-3,5-biscarboxylic acid mononucleotide synthase
MQAERLRLILSQVRAGTRALEDALEDLRDLPYEDLHYARLDHHRALRRGFPEVVYCEGKRTEQIVEILRRLAEKHEHVLATRATAAVYDEVAAALPFAKYHNLAHMIEIGVNRSTVTQTTILVLTAGTADVRVAEEAVVTARALGSHVETLYDVGVAGVHRLLSQRERLDAANVIVAVAGMDGVLPALVGGLVACPVIAAPTSVGYGTGLGGVAAVMTMLNACAPGIAVVNIDNGFGAGYLAHLINTRPRPTEKV